MLRDGFMPNTSVGRFWRLSLRNIAGFLPHKTDKGTFGNTWRVVLAENEDALAKIGWPPNSADMGFAAGDNTVTIARMTGGGVIVSVTGSTPEQMLPYIADGVAKADQLGDGVHRRRPDLRDAAPGARAHARSSPRRSPRRAGASRT